MEEPYFTLAADEAARIIRWYENLAKGAAQIAEKLRAESVEAQQERRAINKGRFVAVCKAFQVPVYTAGQICQQEGSEARH